MWPELTPKRRPAARMCVHAPLTRVLQEVMDVFSPPRYAQFYSQEEFCHYNMFNHHFFEGQVRAGLPSQLKGLAPP